MTVSRYLAGFALASILGHDVARAELLRSQRKLVCEQRRPQIARQFIERPAAAFCNGLTGGISQAGNTLRTERHQTIRPTRHMREQRIQSPRDKLTVVTSISPERFVGAVSPESDRHMPAHSFRELICIQHREHVEWLRVARHDARQEREICGGKCDLTMRQLKSACHLSCPCKIWIGPCDGVVADRERLYRCAGARGMKCNRTRIDATREQHANWNVRHQSTANRLTYERVKFLGSRRLRNVQAFASSQSTSTARFAGIRLPASARDAGGTARIPANIVSGAGELGYSSDAVSASSSSVLSTPGTVSSAGISDANAKPSVVRA